jgi:hypothetical protein
VCGQGRPAPSLLEPLAEALLLLWVPCGDGARQGGVLTGILLVNGLVEAHVVARVQRNLVAALPQLADQVAIRLGAVLDDEPGEGDGAAVGVAAVAHRGLDRVHDGGVDGVVVLQRGGGGRGGGGGEGEIALKPQGSSDVEGCMA